MCLIIASPDAEPIDFYTCRAATRANMDGFGIAYLRPSGVGIRKYQYLDPRDQVRLIRKAARRGPYIVHWRLACAHGDKQQVNKRLAHPFRLSPGAAIAHNGILPVLPPKGESDTSMLVQAMIESGATSAAAAIDAIACADRDSIGYNKFAALCEKGDIYIHGEGMGYYDDAGNWHSNWSGSPMQPDSMRLIHPFNDDDLDLDTDDNGLPQDVDEEFFSHDWRLPE